jgi:hypothetical protein
MSSPDVVQVWPEQDATIAEQLDGGIRALLLDAHFWTDVVSAEQLTRADPLVSRAVAQQVIDRGGDRLRARDGVFLCHNVCAFGGKPFADGLADVRRFLQRNPDEVVTIILQDEVPRADATTVFEEAGLGRYLYDPADDARWPTLGELIERNRRLIVFAENEGPPPGWYQQAFARMADTPFGFPSPQAMTCDHNRGPDDADLLLMNHWVSRAAPDRATAAVVNAAPFLRSRIDACRAERHQLPNFVAVDFATLGDVVGVVQEMNASR